MRPCTASSFQSTLPLRGATTWPTSTSHRTPDFNPRSPCGERHEAKKRQLDQWLISIHAPLAGSDCSNVHSPRSSAISIHAPLAGSDVSNFQVVIEHGLFQSTLPLRGATSLDKLDATLTEISIHAPLAGSDAPIHPPVFCSRDFNPRSPCGERLSNKKTLNPCGIQPTILRIS